MSNRFSDPVIGSDLTWTALVDNRLQDAILPHCQLRSIPGRLAGVILKECQATKTNLRKLSIS